jgi:hypothetical protein
MTKTPEEKVVLMMPKLLKTIKKTMPEIRNKYVAKELMSIAVQLANELKQIKNQELTK